MCFFLLFEIVWEEQVWVFKYLVEFSYEAGLLFIGSFFFITKSISSLVISLFRISVSSWFSLGRLYFIRNLSVSSLLFFSHSVMSSSLLPMDCSMPGFPFHLLELAQNHVHWVGDAIQPSRPPSSPFPPAFNLFQHQGLFQWVSSLH